DDCLARVVALHRAIHLCAVAEIRRRESRADEKEDDISRVQVRLDLAAPFSPGFYLAVVPLRNHLLALKKTEVLLQSLAQLRVFVGVGEEDFDGFGGLRLLLHGTFLLSLKASGLTVTRTLTRDGEAVGVVR